MVLAVAPLCPLLPVACKRGLVFKGEWKHARRGCRDLLRFLLHRKAEFSQGTLHRPTLHVRTNTCYTVICAMNPKGCSYRFLGMTSSARIP